MTIFSRLSTTLLALSLLLINSPGVYADSTTWRLSSQLNLPDWLSIDLEHRTRYEVLDNQYRATINGSTGKGGDQALVFRTLVHAKIDLEAMRIGAELMDSRIALADSGSASGSRGLTTSIVNPVELLQAYIELPFNNLLLEGSQALIRAGRITMNIGSRRLVARNRFRNTINAFTGIEMRWQYNSSRFRAFYTLPIQRRVAGHIVNNRPRFDSEHPGVRFWGLDYQQPFLNKLDQSEFFLFGLDENSVKGRKTRNRQLYTFGIRLWRKPRTGKFDYQLETIYQAGHSRNSGASSETLDHQAHFHHAELGYRFDLPWTPRLILQYDYASGDDNPNDNHNNRFDTLYGARRFDFGPTSIYGAFARSNLNSPGLRLLLKPSPQLSTMISLRGYLRASSAEAWTTAGINGQDLYIGTQIEGRIRWNILPDNVLLETGFVHLFSGDLMTEADKGDVTYGYLQTVLRF